MRSVDLLLCRLLLTEVRVIAILSLGERFCLHLLGCQRIFRQNTIEW
jgi:hypothetical protein